MGGGGGGGSNTNQTDGTAQRGPITRTHIQGMSRDRGPEGGGRGADCIHKKGQERDSANWLEGGGMAGIGGHGLRTSDTEADNTPGTNIVP